MVKPELMMVWFMVLPVPEEYPERLGELEETVHEKVVPATPDVRLMVVVAAEQMVWVRGEVVKAGVGLTVTIISEGVPIQPLAEGIV